MTVDPLEMARDCSKGIMHASAEAIGAQAAGRTLDARDKEAQVNVGLQAMSAWATLAHAELLLSISQSLTGIAASLAALSGPHEATISRVINTIDPAQPDQFRVRCACGWADTRGTREAASLAARNHRERER